MRGQRRNGSSQRSLEAHRQALEVRTREHMPHYWAETQTAWAPALVVQAQRSSGRSGVDRLADRGDSTDTARHLEV